MFNAFFTRLARQAMLALTFAACSGYAAAGTIHVEINTASFGNAGWIELQFNPAPGSTTSATALLSNFSGFTPFADAILDGDASGSLASGFSINNSGAVNAVVQSSSFGGILSFDVTFSGAFDAVGPIGQSVLALIAYDENFGVVGNFDPVDNTLAKLTWTPGSAAGVNGTVGIDVFDQGAVSAVPEPATWLLMGLGLAVVAFTARRRASANDAGVHGALAA